mgnify:CR=1 FL=1
MLNFDEKGYRLFLATGSRQYLEFILAMGCKQILISYAYADPWYMKEIMKSNGVKLLCDSGAFTSWNLAMRKKKEGDPNWKNFLVDLDKYIAFVKQHEDIIWRVVNLDVIPGEQGSEPTEQQREDAAVQGFNNLMYMKQHGINPIHVYHQGEDLIWIDKMVNEGGCDYIGISPCNDYSTDRKERWLDVVFRYMQSKFPLIKTHGFGVTSARLVKRYPWYSTDSSSYSLTAAMGAILTPYGRVYISDDPAGLAKDEHFSKKPQEIQDHINKYLMKRIGYNLKSMMDKKDMQTIVCPDCATEFQHPDKSLAYKPRNFANIAFFIDLEEEVNRNGPNMNFDKQQTLTL